MIDELRTKVNEAEARVKRLEAAGDAARARYQAATAANADLSAVDVDALAAGISIDAESAIKAVRELDSRLAHAREQLRGLRQELYLGETQPEVDAYLSGLDVLMADFLSLAERIEATENLLASVRSNDSRLFHMHGIRTKLRSTVEVYERWRKPRVRRPSFRLWPTGDGKMEHITEEELALRNRDRLARLAGRPVPKRGTVTLGFNWRENATEGVKGGRGG